MEQETSYRQRASDTIRDILLDFECQPILFVGSGLSQRYFNAPTWRELLRSIFAMLPSGEQAFEYHRQKFNDDPVEIGSALSEAVWEIGGRGCHRDIGVIQALDVDAAEPGADGPYCEEDEALSQ